MIPGMNVLFNKIEDASILNLGDVPVVTRHLFLAWHAQQITTRRIARVWKSDVRLQARIEHNRWIVDCQACSTSENHRGAFTHPEWKIACCAECGAVYDNVEFPLRPVRLEIERILLFRPRENRNWFPWESTIDLIQENKIHKVPN